jgi:hypothetical protein
VRGAPEEINSLVGEASDVWPDGFTCPDCGRKCQGFLEEDVSESVYDLLRIRDLTPFEAFSALVAGVGLPEDRQCSGEVIRALLKEHPVRKVVGQDIPNTTRFNLDYLELFDGTKIFFGSSAHGAIVYRITRERRAHG